MKRLLLLLTLLLSAVEAIAAPAVSCHCFQDRSYDPQRPAAADPYILATTQNTLLAAAFGVAKKEVVRAKMAGEDGDRLWVLHYLSALGRIPPQRVAASRAQASDWRGAAQTLGIDPAVLSPRFVALLLRQSSEGLLAAAAADATLIDFCGVEPTQVQSLRDAGASTTETILAALLARKSGQPGVDLFARVRRGRATWGSLLKEVAVEPAEIDTLIVSAP